ncbi:MAG: dihydrodipicolinate synthase family protein [Ancrocorticia sp.]
MDEGDRAVVTLPRGIIPYLPTPLTGSGQLDRDQLRRLIDRLLGAGVSGLSPLGSTGELPALTDSIADDVVATVVDSVPEKFPVIPGILAGSTTAIAERSRAVAGHGARGLVTMMRPWGAVGQRAMIEYFEAAASATDLPMVLYRQPSLGPQLAVSSVVELSSRANIVAIKDASPQTGFLLSLSCAGSSLEVYSASSHVPMLVWELGGIGWMGGPCCIAPHTAVTMWNAWVSGDKEAAWVLQRGLWPLCEAFAAFGPAPMVKGGLAQIGFDVGAPIAPQGELNTDAYRKVSAAIESVRRARAEVGLNPAEL